MSAGPIMLLARKAALETIGVSGSEKEAIIEAAIRQALTEALGPATPEMQVAGHEAWRTAMRAAKHDAESLVWTAMATVRLRAMGA